MLKRGRMGGGGGSIYIYIYIYIFIFIYLCMHACMHACMYVYKYICMYVYIYIYVCVNIYIYIHVYTYIVPGFRVLGSPRFAYWCLGLRGEVRCLGLRGGANLGARSTSWGNHIGAFLLQGSFCSHETFCLGTKARCALRGLSAWDEAHVAEAIGLVQTYDPESPGMILGDQAPSSEDWEVLNDFYNKTQSWLNRRVPETCGQLTEVSSNVDGSLVSRQSSDRA